MVRKKVEPEMGMDLVFSEELPEDAAQKVYAVLGEKKLDPCVEQAGTDRECRLHP